MDVMSVPASACEYQRMQKFAAFLTCLRLSVDLAELVPHHFNFPEFQDNLLDMYHFSHVSHILALL